jgi:hypothetical protein
MNLKTHISKSLVIHFKSFTFGANEIDAFSLERDIGLHHPMWDYQS